MKTFLVSGWMALTFRTLVPFLHAATVSVPPGGDIQAAINGAAANDTIQLQAGNYTIAGALQPKTGMHLLGAGATATTITDGGTSSHYMISIISSFAGQFSGIEIANLTLDGGNDGWVADGIHINGNSGSGSGGSGGFSIHDVTIRHLTGGQAGKTPCGIDFVQDVLDSTVERNLIQNVAGIGCYMAHQSTGNVVAGNTVEAAGTGGIRLNTGCADAVVQGNVVSGTPQHQIDIEAWTGGDRVVIEDNRADHWISVCNSNQSAVRRNVVASPVGYHSFGLELVNSQDAVFTDNQTAGQGVSISTVDAPGGDNEYHFLAYNAINGSDAGMGLQLQGNSAADTYTGRCYFYRDRFQSATEAFRINQNAYGVALEDCQFIGSDTTSSDTGIHVIDLPSGGTSSDVDGVSIVGCLFDDNDTAVRIQNAVPNLLWLNNTVNDSLLQALPSTSENPPGFWEGGPAASLIVRHSNGKATTTAQVGDILSFDASGSDVPGGVEHALWDLNDGPSLSSDDGTIPIPTHAFGKPGNYRVSMVVWDGSGRASRAEQFVAVGDFFEVESLSYSYSGPAPGMFSDSSGVLSNNAGSVFNATAVGQYVAYTIPAVPAGTYEILVRAKTYASRGQFNLYVDPSGGTPSPQNAGGPVDLYSRPDTEYVTLDLGSWTCAATGDHTFKFVVAGKNAGSSGYTLAFDYIELAPPR